MDIVSFLTKHSGDLVVLVSVLGIFIEISPIKVNPLSAIFSWIGRIVNSDVMERMDEISSDLARIQDEARKDHKKQSRILISNFANDIRRGVQKDESQYIAIMDLVNEYLSHGWNSKVRLEAIFIEQRYKEILRNDTEDPYK